VTYCWGDCLVFMESAC